MVIFKIVLIISFVLIFIQDLNERKIYWFWMPLIAITSGMLFYNGTLPELFISASILNLCFVLILILTIFIYARLKLKTNIINVIGIGDVLLFVALAFSFSAISFIVIFLGSLIFSLTIHVSFKHLSNQHPTVPLAGYMSLFFLGAFLIHWSGISVNLYAF